MDGKSLERRVMKVRRKKEEGRSDEVKGSYEHCLKQERDCERKWRMSRQGAFVFSFSSFDEMMSLFEDPSKVALFSDHGRGARQIHSESKKNILAEAMSRLTEIDDELAKDEKPWERKKNNLKRAKQRAKDIAFIKAVLEHKNYEDLGITQSGFNKRLAKICSVLSSTLPPKRSLSDVRG